MYIRDLICLILIIFVGFFARSVNIAVPNEVTFDEIHFGGFINSYINRVYFFDIHPPLGRLTLYFCAKMAGYKGQIHFGHREEYKDNIFITLRQIPTFFGTGVGVMMFFSLRIIGASTFISFTGAMMCALDLCLICESKYILTDGVLHFYASLCLLTYVCLYKTKTYTKSWWTWLVLSSISTGCVISCKHTGLSFIIFGIAFHIVFCHSIKELATRFSFLATLAFLVYYATFAIHFHILIYDSEDGVLMSNEFQQTLIDPANRPVPNNMSLFEKFVELNSLILTNNMMINPYHPYGSKWYTWPLMLSRGPMFWGDGKRSVWSIGNPAVWWLASGGVLFCIVMSFVDRENRPMLALSVFGWAASYFPFALIPRSMWNYHYSIPLIISVFCLNYAISVVKLGELRGILASSVLILTVIGYIWLFPMVYGIPVENSLFINKEWGSVQQK